MRQWKKTAALALSAAMIGSFGGGVEMKALAAAYQDTSGYESLAGLYQEDFRIGVAVQAIDHWNDPTAEIGNEAKEQLIRESFNSMTFGNELKPAYNFSPDSETLFRVDPAAEELLFWAKENSMPVRGHVMVWHSQVDPSIFAKDFKATSGGQVTKSYDVQLDEDCLVDRETLIDRLRTYIYGLTEYTYQKGFADVIYAWDVVNEASEEKEADGLRRSYWYRIIGPEFLYYSFLFAREAEMKYSEEYASLYGLDPETDDLSPIRPLLFYNDYNEWYDSRSTAIVRFLTEDVYNVGQSMVQSDVIPEDGDGTIYGDGLLDGIGMQGHLDDTQNLDQYMRALEKYNDAVGLVHITELDVGETASGQQDEINQAKFYYNFFSRLKEERAKGVNLTSVTFWGLTDDASWRRGANPLLFYGDLGTKPAFDAVVAAAKGEEFTLESENTAARALSEVITFEPYKENGTTMTVPPNSVGFYSRGTGHQSTLVLVNSENHTEDAPIGFCLRVQRKEQDATVRKEINQFIGCSIQVTMHVKTEDSRIVLGLEGNESMELLEAEAGEDWTELSASCDVPADWQSAALYLETDGAADIFIDDITIEVTSASEALLAEPQIEIPVISLEKKDIPETEAMAFAGALQVGWNLGNTMDAFGNPAGDETAWQPVRTTPELFGALREAGFKTVRIPVSWHDHVDGDYTIAPEWLDRVQEIVDYGVNEGMYVILNIHHDNEEAAGCLYPDSAHLEQSRRFVTRIWEQLSERFRDYDEHLIFEAMNEPRLVGHASEWAPNLTDPDVQDAFACINILNQAFVDTVRASGGNNETRYLTCPGYCGSPESVLSDSFILPEDPAGNEQHIMVSTHAYTPYDFALNLQGTDQFDAGKVTSYGDIRSILERLYEKYVSKGIPVLMDEMGSIDKNGNLQSRVEHASYFSACAASCGIPIVWWDNGAFSGDGEIFGIIDRASCEWVWPEIKDALLQYTE